MHERDSARQFELDILMQVANVVYLIDEAGLVIKHGCDEFLQFLFVKTVAAKTFCGYLECLDVLALVNIDGRVCRVCSTVAVGRSLGLEILDVEVGYNHIEIVDIPD